MEGKFPSYLGRCDELGRCDFGDLCGLWKEFALELALPFLWIFLDSLLLVNGDCLQVCRVFLWRGWGLWKEFALKLAFASCGSSCILCCLCVEIVWKLAGRFFGEVGACVVCDSC